MESENAKQVTTNRGDRKTSVSTSRMHFGIALDYIKSGFEVSRPGLHGTISYEKGHFNLGNLVTNTVDTPNSAIKLETIRVKSICAVPVRYFNEVEWSPKTTYPILVQKNENGIFIYAITQIDLFAEDWFIVDDKNETCQDTCNETCSGTR